jgi:hypothetical protein
MRIIERYDYFIHLMSLWYLAGAKEIGITGNHLKPQGLKGGHHFFKNAHELPLDVLSTKYASDAGAFLSRAEQLGGEPVKYGDVATVLCPMPRLPLTVILWEEDDEFPSRVDLLYDSSAEFHAPLDVLWAAAMFTLMVFDK